VQARIALIESDACKLSLKKLDQELLPPAGYNAATHTAVTATVPGSNADSAGVDAAGPGAADVGDDGVRLPPATVEQLQRLLVEVRGCWRKALETPCAMSFSCLLGPEARLCSIAQCW
jgi:hypothetical protein